MDKEFLEQHIINVRNQIYYLEKVIENDMGIDDRRVRELQLRLMQLGYMVERAEAELRDMTPVLYN